MSSWRDPIRKMNIGNLWATSRRLALWAFSVALLLSWHPNAAAYEEGSVGSGGTIHGKVTLKGAIPEPRVFPLVLFPFGSFCKKISDGKGNIVLNEFHVGADHGLQDAVVAVQQVQRGKPFPPAESEFIAVDCMFHPINVSDEEQFEVDEAGKLRHVHPLVGVIRNGQEISVINKDPIIHNSQLFQSEKGNIILNFPLPPSMEQPNGGVVRMDPGKKIAQMICGMHEFMQTWGFLVDNPYYAKTKRDGAFTIEDIPPGTYIVSAWHPHLKRIEKEVTVKPNGSIAVHFEFDADQVTRPHYETQEKFRIGPEALPHKHLEECEPPYC